MKYKDFLFPVQDDKGFVGIGTNINDKSIVYSLRPDTIELEHNSVLHTLPRNTFIKHIRNSRENRLCKFFIRESQKDIVSKLDWPTIKAQGLVAQSVETKKLVRLYYARKHKIKKLFNTYLKRACESADQNALKVARKFSAEQRGLIYKFCAGSLYRCQLMDSFPLAGYYLANNIYGDFIMTLIGDGIEKINIKEAIDLVDKGSKLKYIAAICKIPLSFRKIKPLSISIVYCLMRDGHRSMVPYLLNDQMPQKSMEQYRYFMLNSTNWQMQRNLNDQTNHFKWFAKNFPFKSPFREISNLYSDLSDYIVGTTFEPGIYPNIRPFNSKMSLQSVIEESARYHQELARQRELAYNEAYRKKQEKLVFPEPWFPAHENETLKILPLTSEQALDDEGIRMHHCVATYAKRVAEGSVYIYSVVNDDKNIATLEIRKIGNKFTIGQLRGVCNGEVPNYIQKQVFQWFSKVKGNNDKNRISGLY